MTDCLELKRTTALLYTLAIIKEKEISQYESKILQLKEILTQDPNNAVNTYKYNLAKMRYEQLQRTNKGLRRLKQKLEKLNII